MRRAGSPWLGLLLALAAIPAAQAIDIHRPEVQSFIDDVSQKDAIAKHFLKKLLKAANSQASIIDAMNRPAEKAKPWFEYRAIFLTDRRIRAGTEFWLAHRPELDRASVRTGVPPEFIVAIIGIETFYGHMTGSFRVLDALATLAFDYPARAPFFRDELEQFVLLSRDLKLDPLTVTGSYAGAMGAPQFMPSSYRRYAIDASADGRIDLWNNWSDVCASVGNYLREHGWNSGEPVLSEATVDTAKTADLDGHKLELVDTVESLQSKGVIFDSPLAAEAPALLLAADEADGVHWRVGYTNFFVITRYNHSALYAMAVYELAAAVKQRILEMDAAQRAATAAVTPIPKDNAGAAAAVSAYP